jgi:hypothetical protein
VRLTASDGGTEEEEKGQDERGQERERHREGKTQRRKDTEKERHREGKPQEDISPSRPRSVKSEAPVYLPLLLPASASQPDSHELAPLEDAEV